VTIYVDYDGVCCAFAQKVSDLIGMDINSKKFDDLGQSKRNKLYSQVCDNLDFWINLEPMPDFKELWGYIKYWQPEILTAYPMWSKEAKDIAIKGKHLWNKKYTMVTEERFHCVERKDKQKYALNSFGMPNVLIDDKDRNIKEWESSGGKGILHTNAHDTILNLIRLGYNKV